MKNVVLSAAAQEQLKEFMSNVIDIHGQNDNQVLMKKQEHIKYLDNFIGNEILTLKTEYIEQYNDYNQIKKELSLKMQY